MCTQAGVMSAQQFVLGAKRFVEVARNVGVDWSVLSTGPDQSDTYIQTSFYKTLFLEEPVECGLADAGDVLDDVRCDDASLCSTEQPSQLCKYQCHVLYSPSYQVPVLYVNIYMESGALLSLEELWRQVPAHYQARLQHEKWTFVTQQEHPLLGTPFYQLHPCHTSTLMAHVQAGRTFGESHDSSVTSDELEGYAACRYLVSWLSAVGPVVHLDLPMQLATL